VEAGERTGDWDGNVQREGDREAGSEGGAAVDESYQDDAE
jgi:hypothetical protein